LELVTKIGRLEGRLVACGIGLEQESIEIYALRDRGLPVAQGHGWRNEKVDFRNWERTSLLKYAGGFSEIQAIQSDDHAVWSFRCSGITYIVPALALIRTLFQSRALIEKLFQPQSLEQTCLYLDGPSSQGIDLIGSHRAPVIASNLASWFFCFPSARKTWSSIYQAAVRGKLDLTLPDACAQLRISGVQRNDEFYVTQLNLLELVAAESPFGFGIDCKPDIFRKIPLDTDSALPAASNGEVTVSDEEWQLIQPLVGQRKGTSHVPSQRALLDSVLGKRYKGVSWGDQSNMSGISKFVLLNSFSRWKASGVWNSILQILNDTRPKQLPGTNATSDVAERGRRSVGTALPLNADGQALVSDDEFATIEMHLSKKRSKRVFSLRQLLDFAVEKHCCRVSYWEACKGNKDAVNAVTAQVARWMADQTWAKICELLNRSRSNL
jgi:transposase